MIAFLMHAVGCIFSYSGGMVLGFGLGLYSGIQFRVNSDQERGKRQ